jgi:hypothetical protein
MQFVGAAGRLVAKRSRRRAALPTVHCIDGAERDTGHKENTMTRNIAAQAVSFSLALLVTVSTLVGLNRLAATDHSGQQQVAAAKATRA